MSNNILNELTATIGARRGAASDQSYTRQLLDGGVERCAKKFGEEAVETVIAALSQDDETLKSEAADVIYHLLVLLEVRGVSFDGVLDVLAGRDGISGLEEKAARGS